MSASMDPESPSACSHRQPRHALQTRMGMARPVPTARPWTALTPRACSPRQPRRALQTRTALLVPTAKAWTALSLCMPQVGGQFRGTPDAAAFWVVLELPSMTEHLAESACGTACAIRCTQPLLSPVNLQCCGAAGHVPPPKSPYDGPPAPLLPAGLQRLKTGAASLLSEGSFSLPRGSFSLSRGASLARRGLLRCTAQLAFANN